MMTFFEALQRPLDDLANRGYLIESGDDDVHATAKCGPTSRL
jgi:hypothetical protein